MVCFERGAERGAELDALTNRNHQEVFMMVKTKSLLSALILFLSMIPVVLGQAARPAQTARPRPAEPSAAAPKDVEVPIAKGLKGRVFEVKNRDISELHSAIANLGSGAKGSAMSHSNTFKTITVRDFPENLAAIDEALKRLDRPAPPSPPAPVVPDIEFQIHVLVASSEPAGNEEFPAQLAAVITELKSTLKYKSYSLMASAIHRAKAVGNSAYVQNSGVAETKLLGMDTPSGNPIFYQYALERIGVDSSPDRGTTVQIANLRFGLRVPLTLGGANPVQYENVGFNTPISLKDGERVVVGTTTVKDKGLALVVSAKVVK
jgi:hypothetical protein